MSKLVAYLAVAAFLVIAYIASIALIKIGLILGVIALLVLIFKAWSRVHEKDY